jgi:hypothetical protein
MDTFTTPVAKLTNTQSIWKKRNIWFYYALVCLTCQKCRFLRKNGLKKENFKHFQVTFPSKSFTENFNKCLIFLAVNFFVITRRGIWANSGDWGKCQTIVSCLLYSAKSPQSFYSISHFLRRDILGSATLENNNWFLYVSLTKVLKFEGR